MTDRTMTLEQFQRTAMAGFTQHFIDRQVGGVPLPFFLAAAAAGEAGEALNKVKKLYRDHGGIFPAPDVEITEDRTNLYGDALMEIGDTMAYLAVLAESMGASLDDIAALVFKKLALRRQEAHDIAMAEAEAWVEEELASTSVCLDGTFR